MYAKKQHSQCSYIVATVHFLHNATNALGLKWGAQGARILNGAVPPLPPPLEPPLGLRVGGHLELSDFGPEEPQ